MKINQNYCFWTSYNTKIFKTSRGFSLKLKPYNSVNLAFGRACLYEHFCSCQLYLKKPSEDQNIDHLDHLYVAILCDSYYVFRGLARGKLMSQLLSPNSCHFLDDLPSVRTWFRSRTRVQSAAVRASNSSYSSTMCAKCSRWMCDSYYVFRGLARSVSVVNFVLSETTSKWSKMCFFTIAETPQI